MRSTDIRTGEHAHGQGGRHELTAEPVGAVGSDTSTTSTASAGSAGSGREGAGAEDGAAWPRSGAGTPPPAHDDFAESLPTGTAQAVSAASPTSEVVPGPPGGVLDLHALTAVENRLRALAAAGIDHAVATGARGPRGADADRAMCAAASTIATALWFDTLRAEDRVSVTPHAGPLLGAAHQVLRSALDEATPVADEATPVPDDGLSSPRDHAGIGVQVGEAKAAPYRPPARMPPGAGAGSVTVRRSPRATGAGNVGPTGTIWSALAGRFAGERFDRASHGRQICIIDFAELRDSTVWEAVTDERVSHLGELFWVVLVTGTVPTGGPSVDPRSAEGVSGGPGSTPLGQPGGVGPPARAARMFEAAGWQVLTLRYGRRLAGLFRLPGGAALRARLDAMPPAEYLSLLRLDGAELRRRLAGPGAAGVGVGRLLDGLTDQQIHEALRDLGGHDLPLIIDAFDEVAADRPTVLFAYTGPLPGPARPPADENAAAGTGVPASHSPSTSYPPSTSAPAVAAGSGQAESGAVVGSGGLSPGHELVPRPDRRPAEPLPADSPAGRLARHVASYLDRSPLTVTPVAAVPVDTGHGYPGPRSTQEIFGTTLRELPSLAPAAAAAVVTISTRDADHVLSGWIDAATDDSGRDPTRPAPLDPRGGAGGRHVAGGLSATAFGGVLASLGVAWSRLGLPLLPIGVADELAVPPMLPGWAGSASDDGRSLLAVADTGVDPARPGGWRHGLVAVPGVVCWEPAFAQDLVWCLLDALGRLGRIDGASSLIRLSARPIDQRLAGLPTDPADPGAWWRRRAAVLAGGYRLRDGEPSAPLTLVGMGAVMPEVLRAADELSAGLRREIGVVCVTSPDLLFEALQARRGLSDANDAILSELFPPGRRGPLLTVVDGDPRVLGFLAGVHGQHITTLGSAVPAPPAVPPSAALAPRAGAGGSPGGRVPVDLTTIVGAALDLIDEAATG
ncbi:pyruvate dehydrogenase E1 component [Frankia sp. EI5c]|nr:pyruvate dehydrogenase E1 component [Frankia sp. EI5c]